MFGFAKKLVKQAEGIIAPEDNKGPEYGFRILHVEPGSLGHEYGLEPLFDYILAVNDNRFDASNINKHIYVGVEHSPAIEFRACIQQATDLKLEVWSSKGRVARVVDIRDFNLGRLGVSSQYTPIQTSMNVWHILNIEPDSPAHIAGLQAHADYIVAAEDGLLEEGGESLLGRLIANTDKVKGILLYVYNSDYNVVRPVRVVPSQDGKLGCGVGYGLLHQLPMVSPNLETHPPGSTLFDDNETYLQSEPFGAPAPMPVPVPVPNPNGEPLPHMQGGQLQPQLHAPSRRRRHHPYNNDTDLSAYFNEQTEISHQIDGTSGGSERTPSAAPPGVPSGVPSDARPPPQQS